MVVWPSLSSNIDVTNEVKVSYFNALRARRCCLATLWRCCSSLLLPSFNEGASRMARVWARLSLAVDRNAFGGNQWLLCNTQHHELSSQWRVLVACDWARPLNMLVFQCHPVGPCCELRCQIVAKRCFNSRCCRRTWEHSSLAVWHHFYLPW